MTDTIPEPIADESRELAKSLVKIGIHAALYGVQEGLLESVRIARCDTAQYSDDYVQGLHDAIAIVCEGYAGLLVKK